MRYGFLMAAIFATLVPGAIGAAFGAPSITHPDNANVARGDQLLAKAVAILPSSGGQRLRGQEEIVPYYLETGRCRDALQVLAETETAPAFDAKGPRTLQNVERLAMQARRAGLNDCAVAFSRRWARNARDYQRVDELAEAGALLRLLGNEAEGQALIHEAEAGIRGPLTRTSNLWPIRGQELRVYEGTNIFAPLLERSARDLLATPPSGDEHIAQPSAGRLAAMLIDHGNPDLGRQVAGSDCVRGSNRIIPCGDGGYLDRDLDRLSGAIATGTAAEQKNAANMLYRGGATDRIVPHFPRMAEIEGGNKAAAFRSLAFYSNALWPKDPVAAEEGARQALALGVTGPDADRGLDASSWRVWNAHLAKILAGAGDDRSVKQIVRRVAPQGKDRERVYAAIAAGYARFGNDAAVQHYVKAITDKQAQRRAWWGIAFGTPGLSVETRLRAAERARAIPYVADPKAGYGYVGPPPGMVNCGEFGGGAMIASEGAPAEALFRFAQFSREEARVGPCAYRRFLLDAAEGAGKGDRAKAVALELLRTTERPCGHMACDDLRVLKLLVDLQLYDEAERLAMMFDEADRIRPLMQVALGLVRSE